LPFGEGTAVKAQNVRLSIFCKFDLTVQYDSISVRNGRHYPIVNMSKFLNWAAKDVTEELKAASELEKSNAKASA
jgi:hypothetical protein